MELTANHNITQIVDVCSDFEKRTKLIKHLDIISAQNAKVLIFVGTKRVADDITKYLRQDGWPALAIHGDKEQYVSYVVKLECRLTTPLDANVTGSSANSRPVILRSLSQQTLPPVVLVCVS